MRARERRRGSLEEVGTYLHLARSGRIIIRLSRELGVGTVIYDEKGKAMGKVAEVFGPVASPYASIIPTSEKVRVSEKVYVSSVNKFVL